MARPPSICPECSQPTLRPIGGLVWKQAPLWRCADPECGAVVGRDLAKADAQFLAGVGKAAGDRDDVVRHIVVTKLDHEGGERLAPIVAVAMARGRLAAFEPLRGEEGMTPIDGIEKALRSAVRVGKWSGSETKESVMALARHRAEQYYLANKAPTRAQALQLALAEPIDPWERQDSDTNPSLATLHDAAPADAADAARRARLAAEQDRAAADFAKVLKGAGETREGAAKLSELAAEEEAAYRRVPLWDSEGRQRVRREFARERAALNVRMSLEGAMSDSKVSDAYQRYLKALADAGL